MHRRDVLAVTAGSMIAIAGCTSGGSTQDGAMGDETLTLTTTTSTYDTGLLAELNEAFEDRFGADVDAVVQGTGAALEMGRRGDTDAILVHARSLEDEFLREGYGVNRRSLMFNDFVLIGPTDDPAGVARSEEITEAMAALAEGSAVFVSRGDNSGTHRKERELWEKTGIDPTGSWYREVGASMGEVLNHASMEEGYTLTDRGTYLARQSDLDSLTILVQGPIEGGPSLLANPYGLIAVNPGIHEHVAYDLAMAYIGFLTSPAGQEIIGTFSVNGEQLFFPDAISANPDFEQHVPEGWTAT